MAELLGWLLGVSIIALFLAQIWITYTSSKEIDPPIEMGHESYLKYLGVTVSIVALYFVPLFISIPNHPGLTGLTIIFLVGTVGLFWATSLHYSGLRFTWIVGGFLGILTLLSVIGSAGPPASIAILAGAVVAAFFAFLVPQKTNFPAAEATYFLGSALSFWVLDVPDVYSQDASVGLVLFGSISAGIVAVRWIVGKSIILVLEDYTDPTHASRIWEFISAVAGLILIIWTVLTAQEKLARYGGSAGVGTATMALNVLGIQLPIPVWFLEGIDASIVVFIGSVAVGFHVLDTLYSGWFLAKSTAQGAAEAGRKATAAGSAAATSVTEKASEAKTNSPSLADKAPFRNSSGGSTGDPQDTSQTATTNSKDNVETIDPIQAVSGMDGCHAAILKILSGQHPLSIQEIANSIDESVYTVSQHVADLEDAGVLVVEGEEVRVQVSRIEFESIEF